MSRTLVAFIGYHDPFYGVGSGSQGAQKVEHSMPLPRHVEHSAWVDKVLQSAAAFTGETAFKKIEQDGLRFGPLVTSVLSLTWKRLAPDRVVLLFAPEPDKINWRLSATEKCVHFIDPETKFDREKVRADVADYESAFENVSQAIGQIGFHEEEKIMLLLGPGTPALNFGLAMQKLGRLAQAELWQVLRPADIQEKTAKLANYGGRKELKGDEYVKQIDLGLGLEAGGATPRELLLEREIKQLKRQLADAESSRTDAIHPALEDVQGRKEQRKMGDVHLISCAIDKVAASEIRVSAQALADETRLGTRQNIEKKIKASPELRKKFDDAKKTQIKERERMARRMRKSRSLVG